MLTRSLLLVSVCLFACSSPGSSKASLAAGPPRIIRAEAYIEAPYGAVWTSFATAGGYGAWASTPCKSFGRIPGDPVVWGDERIVYRGTLTRMEHGAGLAHTFQFVGFDFEERPSPVEIEIVEAGSTVRVTIEHDCTGAPETYAMISPVGWSKSLSRLKTLLETGDAMPWPDEVWTPR